MSARGALAAGLLLLVPVLAAAQPAEKAPGREIVVEWRAAKQEAFRPIERQLRSNPSYDRVLKFVDELLVFPRELKVTFTESGKVNAWYTPSEHSVTMSYELVDYLARLFRSAGLPPKRALELADEANVFIFLHELGHAVIGELELPTTGKEEDAADEFALIIALEALEPKDVGPARAAAEWFRLMGTLPKGMEDLHFWDEHSLDAQRAYRILAKLYASEPKKHRFLEEQVPRERLQLAQLRFRTKPGNWARLVDPWREENAYGWRGGGIRMRDGDPKPGNGDLRILVEDGTTPQNQFVAEQLRAAGAAKNLELLFDSFIAFPRDVTVVYRETGRQYVPYNHRKQVGVISLDFLSEQCRLLYEHYGESEQLGSTIGGMLMYWSVQEVARVLIHELRLSYTGELEDSSAELAMIFMTLMQGENTELLVGVSLWYAMLKERQVDLESLPVWSPASLDQQRFYEALCFTYGSDPEAYSWVEALVPASRLARAKREYPVKRRNWERLLSEYWVLE